MSINFTESQLKYLSQFEGETRIEMELTLRIGIVASQYHKGDEVLITIWLQLKKSASFTTISVEFFDSDKITFKRFSAS